MVWSGTSTIALNTVSNAFRALSLLRATSPGSATIGQEFSMSSKCCRDRSAFTTCCPAFVEARSTLTPSHTFFQSGSVKKSGLTRGGFYSYFRSKSDLYVEALGCAFSMFGGLIVGRNVELVRDQRIVQAWRPTHWDPRVYSIVRFAFRTHAAGTTVVLDHTGFPAGQYDHLNTGWQTHYWGPVRKFLA